MQLTLTELTEGEFKLFQKYIYELAGIHLVDYKRTLVSNRIRRRLRALKIESFAEYYDYLTSAKTHREELPLFLNEITTNETYFFRDEHQYEWLARNYIPEVITAAREGKRPRTLRIWSAACSTGEEPYSIAISLLESLRTAADWRVEIVATDLSQAVLHKAQQACYNDRAVHLVKPVQLKQYFIHEPNGPWKLKPAIVQQVTFQHHNLLEPMKGGPFDCIFIKNVLIYFDEASKKRVVSHLLKGLAKDGYLVVGPSEGIFQMLTPLHRHHAWLYQSLKN